MPYLKWKVNNLFISHNHRQIGRGKQKKVEDIEDKLIKNIFRKGNRFWYNNSLKLLLNSGNPNKAYKSIIKYIYKKKQKYIGKEMILISVNDWGDKTEILPARIEVGITVYKISEVLGNIALPVRDRTHSHIRTFFTPNEFDRKHFSKLAKACLDRKIKEDKYYTIKDLKKLNIL